MKPTIGVVLRPDKNINQKNVQIIYDNIYKTLIDYGANVIGIVNDDRSLELLKMFDGIMLQGGSEATNFDYALVKYCYENDIPLLGICLGMQTIGEVFGGKLKEIDLDNHYDNSKLHNVTIYNNTKLFEILGDYNIQVNSRHHYELKNTNLTISARSNDGVIEAIEDTSKKFFIGLEWHPEDLASFDKYSKKIFEYFINVCKKG